MISSAQVTEIAACAFAKINELTTGLRQDYAVIESKIRALEKERLGYLKTESESLKQGECEDADNRDNLIAAEHISQKIIDLQNDSLHVYERHIHRVINEVGELAIALGFTYSPCDLDHFGPSLREARSRKGISLQELAERTGLDAEYLAKIEYGKIDPTNEHKEMLEGFLEGKL